MIDKDKKEINYEIGMRIKTARERMGYTQEKFAETIDRSVQFISDLERGKFGPSIQTLIRICDALYVTTDFLILGKETKVQDGDSVLNLPSTLTEKEREILQDGINVLLRAFYTNKN